MCLVTDMKYNGHASIEMWFCMTMKEPNTRILRSKAYSHVSKECSLIFSILFKKSYPPLGNCTVSLTRRMLFVLHAVLVCLHTQRAFALHSTLGLLSVIPVLVSN